MVGVGVAVGVGDGAGVGGGVGVGVVELVVDEVELVVEYILWSVDR